MDDTDLPGLLPTVGFADARITGLDGIINILREKLGQERVAATYAGRVPETQADIELLIALRPDFWEHWLYAGALRVGLGALETKYRDYEMGFAPQSGDAYFGRDAFDFLRTAPAIAESLVGNFNAIFKPEVQSRAFGEPGEPGDPERLLHLAKRFIDVYESFLDEAARLRGAALPEDFRDAQVAAAEFGGEAIEQIRAFVAEVVEQMSGLPELAAGHADDDEPLSLHLTITLTVNDAVTQRFIDGLERGVESL
jgi:hypothetical protein